MEVTSLELCRTCAGMPALLKSVGQLFDRIITQPKRSVHLDQLVAQGINQPGTVSSATHSSEAERFTCCQVQLRMHRVTNQAIWDAVEL